MTAHTDGPWQYDDYYVLKSEDGSIIAELWTPDVDANGRLIAAAPDMLAALDLFVKQWNACGPNSAFGSHFSNVRDAAVAAISKATTP